MISQITNINPDVFLEKELEIRKINNLPPFERFVSLILSGTNEKKIEKDAYKLRDHLNKYLNAKILGPVSAPKYKIKKNFRFRLLIRSKKNVQIQKDLSLSLKNFRFSIGLKLTVDVDPISFN